MTTMSVKNRAAIVRIGNSDALALFSADLLWRPVGAVLADALVGAGVERLLIVTNEAPPASLLSAAHETCLIPHGARDRYIDFIRDTDAAVFFTLPALIDAEPLSELFSCAAHLGPTILTSGGEHVAFGLSGSALVESHELLDNIIADCPSGFRVLEHTSGGLCMPVRNLSELSRAENLCRDRVNARLMASGVRIIGPETCYIAEDAQIEPGATILPGTIIRTGCSVGAGTQLGPYVYIREHCHIGRGCRIGDFVELKNANIADGTKVSHLTYVGDADVGERVNFGCGTVTVNYNGGTKSRTVIGDDAFIGCNTNLVAPVTVGARAYTAAGSTVTHDVPEGALAISRSHQVNKEGYGDRLMKKFKEEKKQ